MPKGQAQERFYLVEDKEAGGWRVFDRVQDWAVDGPWLRKELAEARAAKRNLGGMSRRRSTTRPRREHRSSMLGRKINA